MPTYQYKCQSCEHRFDVMQRITEDPLSTCPECGGTVKRVLFPAGVVFKGSGWYVTDYRNASEKAKYESDTKGDSPAPSTATDKKPETPATSVASETTKSEPSIAPSTTPAPASSSAKAA